MKIRPAAWLVQRKSILTLRYDYPEGTLYALPGGGQEAGESLKETLLREMREELDVEVAVESLLWVGEAQGIPHLPDTLHLVFLCTIIDGIPTIQPHATKAREAIWLPLEKLLSVTLYPGVGPWFRSFSRRSIPYAGRLPHRVWL